MDKFPDFIVYADESGDHNIQKLDADFPVFCLSLCMFRTRHYLERVVPRFQALKFNYFGHDNIILQEREMRKQLNDFRILGNPMLRKAIFSDIAALIRGTRFSIAAAVIDKRRMRSDLFPESPYDLALKVCLQKIVETIGQPNDRPRISIVFEMRGKREDED